MQLSPAVEKYVLHWGEMGTKWGISRSEAQIHALLYLSPRPLHAEDAEGPGEGSGASTVARATTDTTTETAIDPPVPAGAHES